MKRKAEEIDEKLANFPIDQLPTDVIVSIFLESGFTIPELHTLCNLSHKLRGICNDRKIWDRIFVERIMGQKQAILQAQQTKTLPELFAKLRDEPLYKEWIESEKFCKEPFTRLAAFAYRHDLITKRFGQVLFLHDQKPSLMFALSTDDATQVWFTPEEDDAAITDEDDLSESDQFWIAKYEMKKANDDEYSFYLAYLVPSVIRLFCDLLDNGYHPHRGDNDGDFEGDLPMPTLVQSCMVCQSTGHLLQCSGPCQRIYCSTACQSKHH